MLLVHSVPVIRCKPFDERVHQKARQKLIANLTIKRAILKNIPGEFILKTGLVLYKMGIFFGVVSCRSCSVLVDRIEVFLSVVISFLIDYGLS